MRSICKNLLLGIIFSCQIMWWKKILKQYSVNRGSSLTHKGTAELNNYIWNTDKSKEKQKRNENEILPPILKALLAWTRDLCSALKDGTFKNTYQVQLLLIEFNYIFLCWRSCFLSPSAACPSNWVPKSSSLFLCWLLYRVCANKYLLPKLPSKSGPLN